MIIDHFSSPFLVALYVGSNISQRKLDELFSSPDQVVTSFFRIRNIIIIILHIPMYLREVELEKNRWNLIKIFSFGVEWKINIEKHKLENNIWNLIKIFSFMGVMKNKYREAKLENNRWNLIKIFSFRGVMKNKYRIANL